MTMFNQQTANSVAARGSVVRATRLESPWITLSTLILAVGVGGCGTTRMSDTLRTGTEQMLLSSAIERSINDMDFSVLEGKDVYFDPQYLKGVSDEGYIISSLRQKLLAEGVLLKEKRESATYVVEARAGAVGTNRQDVLLGVPQTTLPTAGLISGVPSAIPEIPLAKKTKQKGVVKLAAFAYNQVTGQAVWQSGTYPVMADARDTWILGTGPFQHGSIYKGTRFAGDQVKWLGGQQTTSNPNSRQSAPGISVTSAASFEEDPSRIPPSPPQFLHEKPSSDAAIPALFSPVVPPSQPQPGQISTPPPSSNSTAAPSSGFTSSTFGSTTGQTPNASSGGSAAAAGLLFLQNRPSQ
jgi:hypothetical protein